MEYNNESIDRLFQVIADLDTSEKCRSFFEDLCTIKEIQDMAQRLDTAILLDQGMNYQKIGEKVGISSATISRVSRALSYGSDGYRMVLEYLKEKKR